MSTYTAICYHLVFSTKDRAPVLAVETRQDLYRYISGILKNRECHLYRINGVADHLHTLTGIHATVSLANLVKDIKTGTSKWIKGNSVFPMFSSGQDGYGAFTVSQHEISGLIEYVKCQEEHHRKVTFEEEYRKFLLDAGIEFDERYFP
jgi:REP-associated tyrosine transposase